MYNNDVPLREAQYEAFQCLLVTLISITARYVSIFPGELLTSQEKAVGSWQDQAHTWCASIWL